MANFYEEVLKMIAQGQKGAAATIINTVGSVPREVGAKMLIREDGSFWGTVGGGCLEAKVWQEARLVIKEEKPRIIHIDLTGREAEELGMLCGGVMDIYIEPIIPPPRVYIFGGGHISLYLSKLSSLVGFQVTVIDDRPQFANKERFPEANEVIAEKFSAVFGNLKIDQASYVVIVTRGHTYDQEILEWALGTKAKYIGMIGSRKKVQTVYKNLQEKGIPPEDLQKVHAPIGLDIGALTPEEIAIAIVAEMIAVRRKGEISKGSSSKEKMI